MRTGWRTTRVVLGAVVVFGCLVSEAWAVNPGWECVPTTAGQAVTSGGTGAAPSCAAGNTAVLAPTYVPSGVGGQPTVRFGGVNVQVVSGSGSTTGTVNGRGNLVIGYDEKPGNQSGSHNLILGTHQEYSSYGSIVAGSNNFANRRNSVVLGFTNETDAPYATVTGGMANHASDRLSTISGGCKNETGSGGFIGPACSGNGMESVSGGTVGAASGPLSSISGGQSNTASGSGSSGTNVIASWQPGGEAILGGFAQHVTAQDGTYPAGP
jgi:hypothetical protein